MKKQIKTLLVLLTILNVGCSKIEDNLKLRDGSSTISSPGSGPCGMADTRLICEWDRPPFVIDDVCTCIAPCVNCLPTVVIFGKVALFVDHFNLGTLSDFFSTDDWEEVFPDQVGTSFATDIINGDVKFLAKEGIDEMQGKTLYLALPANSPDVGFDSDDVIVALPIFNGPVSID